MSQLYYCVRVYPNGEAKHTLRAEEGMRGWIEYNLKFRFGNALFVNGKRVLREDGKPSGNLSEEQMDQVETFLATYEHSLTEDKIGHQEERYGGIVDRWEGYRPERVMSNMFFHRVKA